jgi:cytochrome c
MSSCRDVFAAVLAGVWLQLAATAGAQPVPYPGIGRPATPKELAAWDIDVRPDFKGLPKGAGSVAKGMEVWEGKCSSCHGVFGESNEVFNPIVGGTTRDDIRTGRVARLDDRAYPGRTTLMKLSTVSTLWDYINRAMPWTAPKSLTPEEVYGVTAYILNMGGIVPDDFTLSDRNVAEVQKLLPNRNGMTTDHALWPGAAFGKRNPDVLATACMKDCIAPPQVASSLPDHARNAHGNLAMQNRLVGAQRGADTTRPAGAQQPAPDARSDVAVQAAPAAPADRGPEEDAAAAQALTRKYTCVACHGVENKIVGPSFRDIAQRYAGRSDAAAYLAGKVKTGGSGVWGSTPMPPQALQDAEAKTIAQWLAEGAKK